MSVLPIIDLEPWFHGDARDRAEVAGRVDAALRDVGFLLVTGHGVPPALPADTRAAARSFFALPTDVKARYAVSVQGRGWLPPGVEANGFSEGTETPPDLKESLTFGADRPTGDPVIDDYWFGANVFPAEVPQLQGHVETYLGAMRALADELLRVCAAALGVEDDFFTRHTGHATHTLNVNRYPPAAEVGRPADNQFRIGPHTDFGTVTILDREPGLGGLQVWTAQDGWADAPWVPGALTINTGDLLSRWVGERWISNRHRVLPPQAAAPDEDLVSLVFFYECDHDTVVSPLPPPVGRGVEHPPVVAREFLRERLDAITLG